MQRPTVRHVPERDLVKQNSKYDISIKSLLSACREPCKRGRRLNVRGRGKGVHKENTALESTGHVSYEHRDLGSKQRA